MAHDPSLSAYYASIKDCMPLSREKEKELATKIQQGNKEALDQLVTANLKFVVKIAKRYNTSESVMDLIAQGNLGLIEAAKKFDPSLDNKFITYAIWHIKQKIQIYLAKSSNLPINDYNLLGHIKTFISKYQKKHNSEILPPINVIAKEFDLHESLIKDLLASQSYLSLDAPLNDESNSFLDSVSDNYNILDDVIQQDINSKVRKVINKLDDRLKYIIYKRYGLDDEEMTLEEIGQTLGLTRERVRQLEIKAFTKLKNTLTKYGLSDLFGRESQIDIITPIKRRRAIKG